MITTISHGPIRELRLSRPPVNALSPELIAALKHAVEIAPQDGARAIVLSGARGRFSGGLDLPLLLALDRAAMADLLQGLYSVLRALACSPIPVIAAITGHAPAGGTVLALCCDWRVMAEGDWKIGLNEVQVGLILPPVIHHALQLVVGYREAERLAVTGVLVSPAEAARIGLVDEIIPAANVVACAVERAQAFLALPPQAMAGTRAQARAALVALLKQDLNEEIDDILTVWWRPETQRVLQAVIEQMRKKKQNSAANC